MTVSTDIFTTLSPLVAGRVYPDTFMQPDGKLPIWPAIRYGVVGGEVYASICGSGDGVGVGYGDTTRLQIDVVDKTHAGREVLVGLVRAAMLLTTIPTTLLTTPRNEYDAETKTFRAIMEYYFHA